MPLLLLLLHLTLSMRNRHCFVTATTNALAHLILLLPGHLHLAMAMALALATEIRSSNRLAGSAAMDTCSAIIAVTGPSSVPFAVSRWGRADVACCRINYSRCSPRISPAMEVSTRGGGFAFNGQQTGASFRLLPPSPRTVASRLVVMIPTERDKLLICLQCVSCWQCKLLGYLLVICLRWRPN